MNPEEQKFKMPLILGPTRPQAPMQGPAPMQGAALPPVQNTATVQNPLSPEDIQANAQIMGVEQPITPQVDQNLMGAQTFLNEAGFNAGPVDGIFGPKTQAGLTAFQQAQGIPTTGQLDAATQRAISAFQFPRVEAPQLDTAIDVTQLEQPRERLQLQQPQPELTAEPLLARTDALVESLTSRIGEISDTRSNFENELLRSLTGEGETGQILQAEQEAGLPELRKELTNIVGQIKQEQAALRAGQQALENQGDIRVAGTLGRRQEQLQQQSTNRILALSATAEVLQGNISNAETYIARLARANTENEANRIEALKFNLERLAEQERSLGNEKAALQAEARAFQEGERLRLLEAEAQEREGAYAIATEALTRGANSQDVARFLQNPNVTRQEAIALFGEDIQAPTEAERLDQELMQARIATERAQAGKIADQRRVANAQARTFEELAQNNQTAFTNAGIDISGVARRVAMGIGGTGDERGRIVQDIIASQDPVEEIKVWGVQKLPNAEAEEYRNVQNSVIPQLESAIAFMEANPDIGFGNINKIKRNVKKKFGEQSPEYENIVFLLEGVNAPIRNAIFGASLTEGEQRAANLFLIDTADTREVIVNKSKGLLATQDFAAERAALQSAGLTLNEIKQLEDAGEILSFEQYQELYGVDPSFIRGSEQQTNQLSSDPLGLGL